MLSLPDRASLERAISTTDNQLSDLLAVRLALSIDHEPDNMSHYIIVDKNDDEDDFVEEFGFSPLRNPIDGISVDDPGFHPWWDALARHGHWAEFIFAVGNDGFAYIVFVKKPAITSESLQSKLWRTAVHYSRIILTDTNRPRND